jgi:hypothetical protein
MKKGYTDISIVLDRSGSMDSVKSDTIGGFNSFLKAQKEVPGEATITLAQFDDIYEVVYEGIRLQGAPLLNDQTFVPRGTTALLDAIGRTINATGKRLAAIPETERPEKVIFVILTDGYENASREFKVEQINDMIRHQRDVYAWEIVFIGANQDAITSASQMGIQAANALTYAANTVGTQQAFSSLTQNIAAYRTNQKLDMSFSQEDREKQKNASKKS